MKEQYNEMVYSMIDVRSFLIIVAFIHYRIVLTNQVNQEETLQDCGQN